MQLALLRRKLAHNMKDKDLSKNIEDKASGIQMAIGAKQTKWTVLNPWSGHIIIAMSFEAEPGAFMSLDESHLFWGHRI